MGVTGAALATFTGRSACSTSSLLKGTERIHILARHLRLRLDDLRLANRHAVCDCPHQLDAHREHLRSGRARWIHRRHASSLPSWGLSNAAATRQNKPERRERGLAHAFSWEPLAKPVVRLINNDPTVVPLAALRILSYGNIGYAYGMVMLQAFNPGDHREFLLLVVGDSAGLLAGDSPADAVERRVLGIVIADMAAASAILARPLEKAENLRPLRPARSENWGGRNGFEPSSPGWSPGALPWLCYSRVRNV
jgi:hypothetical protein